MKYFNGDYAIIIPVFNEARQIPQILEKLAKSPARIICVDDGSFDETYEILSKYESVELVKHCLNRGQGAALQTGFDYLKQHLNSTKFVITFDADGQHQMEDIEKFLKAIRAGDKDILFGNRFAHNRSNVPKLKSHLLRASSLWNRLFLKVELNDSQNGFRCLNLRALRAMELKCDGYDHADEIISIAGLSALRVGEVPVTVRYTEYSKSKGQPLINILNMIFRKFGG